MLQVFELLPIKSDSMSGVKSIDLTEAIEVLKLLNAYNYENLSIIMKVSRYINLDDIDLKMKHATINN